MKHSHSIYKIKLVALSLSMHTRLYLYRCIFSSLAKSTLYSLDNADGVLGTQHDCRNHIVIATLWSTHNSGLHDVLVDWQAPAVDMYNTKI